MSVMVVMVVIRSVRESLRAPDVLRGVDLAVCVGDTHGIKGVADAHAVPSKVR